MQTYISKIICCSTNYYWLTLNYDAPSPTSREEEEEDEEEETKSCFIIAEKFL